jgi:hypothetical protein
MTIYEVIDQSYALAHGMLAVTNFFTGTLDIPENRRLDINRYELSVKVAADGYYRSNNSVIHVNGAPSSAAYQDLRLMINDGAGTVAPDYSRVEAGNGSTGPVIARKTAVRGVATSSTVWAEQINLGPYTQAGIWFAADGQQTPVERVIVVQNSLDLNKAVVQWNKSAASPGDYLRTLNPDSSYSFRITGEGDIIWGQNDSLRGELNRLRAEIADLRSQVQLLTAAPKPN